MALWACCQSEDVVQAAGHCFQIWLEASHLSSHNVKLTLSLLWLWNQCCGPSVVSSARRC
jgi:hypothetical protein